MSSGNPISQFELQSPPEDGITNVVWCNNANKLVVTSWDKSVAIYNVKSENSSSNIESSYQHKVWNTNINLALYFKITQKKTKKIKKKAAVLDCVLNSDDTKIFSVGCDCVLLRHDLHSGLTNLIGIIYLFIYFFCFVCFFVWIAKLRNLKKNANKTHMDVMNRATRSTNSMCEIFGRK